MQTSKRGRRDPARESRKAALSSLPSVSKLLESRALAAPRRRFGVALVTDLLREALAELRRALNEGRIGAAELRRGASATALAAAVTRAAEELLAPRPRKVVNATGIIVHTNLGRSTLSESAAPSIFLSSRP